MSDALRRQPIPHGLVEGDLMPASRGFVEGGWLIEEDSAATRLGIRVQSKLYEERSPYQHIGVYQSAFFGRLLTLDGIMMFTERDEFVYHEMLTHVPLCSMAEPKSVLIIGGGDCGCLREVLRHPTVERVVQCDIDQRVTEVARRWFDWVAAASTDSRAELIYADGVRFIERNQRAYDLIIIDSTDPNAVKSDAVHPRRRYERGELGQQIERLKEHRRGAVPPRSF